MALDVFYSSYGYPGIVNPGVAYTAHSSYIINTSNSYVELNTFHDWYDDGTHNLEQHNFDVETILVHEVGHIHGLAHPLTNSYTHDATAPIMAGGDNEYFWDHMARSLRTDDTSGTRFLQYNTWVPNQCATIQIALNNSFSGVTIHVTGSQTLSGNLSIPSGISLNLENGSSINLSGYYIISTGGTIAVESGATLNPDIRLQTGSSIVGLYPTITSAFNAASGGQWVHIRGTHTFADHFTVPSGKILKTESNSQMNFASGKYLYVYGTLNAYNTTYTASSGTWGGIRFYSGSSGSIQYANINNATYGVYASSSSPTIDYANISNCTYGIRPYYSNLTVTNSTISNCSYGVYSYYGSPSMSNNTISSCTYGAYLNHAGNAVVNTNEITACTRGIYGYYAGLSDFTDNYITSGGTSRVAGIQVYNTTEPTVYNNTIEGSFTYGLDADHYSRPLAIGPSSQDYQGYNRIIGGQTATVYIHDHSESVLGTCFSSDGYAGYNTIYLDIQTDRFAHIRAENYSNIRMIVSVLV